MNALEGARKLFKLEAEIKILRTEKGSNSQAIATFDYFDEEEKNKMETTNEDINKVLPSLTKERELLIQILEKTSLNE